MDAINRFDFLLFFLPTFAAPFRQLINPTSRIINNLLLETEFVHFLCFFPFFYISEDGHKMFGSSSRLDRMTCTFRELTNAFFPSRKSLLLFMNTSLCISWLVDAGQSRPSCHCKALTPDVCVCVCLCSSPCSLCV